MKITKPDDLFVGDTIKQIIDATGREVTLHLPGQPVLCPTCAGSDPFCTTCSGNVRVFSGERAVPITGAVRWKSMERKRYRPEGQYVEGDCSVVLAYTPDLDTTLLAVDTVLVDGRICVLESWRPFGNPINRFLLILQEDENTHGSRVS